MAQVVREHDLLPCIERKISEDERRALACLVAGFGVRGRVHEAILPDGLIVGQEREIPATAVSSSAMSAWAKLDDLVDRVAKAPVIEIKAKAVKSLDAARAALRDSNFMPDRIVVLGWEVLLSRRKQDGIVIWHLSAKLHPHGRSSTENDWKVVGKIAARVGAPPDPVLMPNEPNAAIHWSWTDQ